MGCSLKDKYKLCSWLREGRGLEQNGLACAGYRGETDLAEAEYLCEDGVGSLSASGQQEPLEPWVGKSLHKTGVIQLVILVTVGRGD